MAQIQAQSDDLKMNCKELLATGIFSDLTLRCQGHEFKVHKCILYLQSPTFRKMIGGAYKEASQSTISLDEDDPEVLQVLIHYLYNFVYEDSFRKSESLMTFTVKVYAIADYYDVKKLQDFAAKRLNKVCDPTRDLDDFVRCISLINAGTQGSDRTLWDIVIPKIKENITFLLGTEAFKELIEQIPQLKFDLLRLLDPNAPAYMPKEPKSPEVPMADPEDEDDEGDAAIPFPAVGGSVRGRTNRYQGPGRRLG